MKQCVQKRYSETFRECSKCHPQTAADRHGGVAYIQCLFRQPGMYGVIIYILLLQYAGVVVFDSYEFILFYNTAQFIFALFGDRAGSGIGAVRHQKNNPEDFLRLAISSPESAGDLLKALNIVKDFIESNITY